MRRHVRTYKRDELYELIWSKPTYQVAKQYGISDVALRKVCKHLALPLPARGHWLRAEADREPRPALEPRAGLDEYTSVWYGARASDVEVSEKVKARVAAAAAPHAQILVAPTLTKLHPLVAAAAKQLKHARPSNGLVDAGDDALAICVSPSNVQRALRIMDALIKALEARGHEVALREVPYHRYYWPERSRIATMTCVEGEWVEFALDESLRRDPLPSDLTDKERRSRKPERMGRPRRPTGNLVLTIREEPPRHWRDRSRRKVESFLNEFVSHLYLVADRIKQQRLAVDEQKRREEEAQQLAEERARRAAEEKRRIEDLHERIERWRLARDIREYVAALRSMEADFDDADPVTDHIEWALRHADSIDPVARVPVALAARAQRSNNPSTLNPR